MPWLDKERRERETLKLDRGGNQISSEEEKGMGICISHVHLSSTFLPITEDPP
jgi:hypothetical protein